LCKCLAEVGSAGSMLVIVERVSVPVVKDIKSSEALIVTLG